MGDTSPLICSECLRRIWRWSDGGSMVDSYINDRHLSCSSSVEAVRERREQTDRWEKNRKPL